MGAVRSTVREQLRKKLLQPDVISGSEMLLRSLLLEGVEFVFGYPGGAVLYIYDAIYNFDGFKHVLARHEQGAIHAADGYARASGKTGVCIATSGPGATNLITGVAMAYRDNIPLVVITGNVPSVSRGTDAFQEADVIGMTLPITKHSYYVTDVEDIPAMVQAAFQIASTGRKGPVLIDLPKDISSHKKPFRYREKRVYNPQIRDYPDEAQIDAVLQELERASKPLILFGEGIDDVSAYSELLDFAEKANIPFAWTSHHVSRFPMNHHLGIGISNIQGNALADRGLRECDLLIVVGSRMDHRIHNELTQLSAAARIVHMDYDDDSDSAVFIHAGCYGEPALALRAAAQRVKSVSASWIGRRITERSGSDSEAEFAENQECLSIADVLRMMSDSVSSDVVVTVDEEIYHEKVIELFDFDRRCSLICPIGMEYPGYSLPAAIGAQMANLERTVISLNGEAGIQRSTHELAVCAIHDIPLRIVIFTKRNRMPNACPDFMKLAEAYGITGLRTERLDEAREVWKKALDSKGPVLVEFSLRTS